ncbi:IS66 family insertion sequence element accessory protein TnpB [Terripilifer ovatus]|uniref:IS66 family insertion sequence element accessory protein TnpB n=1 Tax=Terripilifer ovatus TaxID=3032367 RepID=UPI003AB94332
MDASLAQTAALHPKSLHSQLRYKRLEDGEFRWSKIGDGVMRLSAAQFSALLEGLDWERVQARETAAPTLPG